MSLQRLIAVDLYLRKIYGRTLSGTWTYIVSGSDDRVSWKELGRASGSVWPDMSVPGPSFKQSIALASPARVHSYRIELSAPNIPKWGVAEAVLFDRDQEVRVAGPEHFNSAWMSAGGGEEWVSVDLGATCTFDRVALAWIRRASRGSDTGL